MIWIFRIPTEDELKTFMDRKKSRLSRKQEERAQQVSAEATSPAIAPAIATNDGIPDISLQIGEATAFDSTDDSTPEGSLNSTPEGSPNSTSEGSPNSTPEGSPHSTPEGSRLDPRKLALRFPKPPYPA
ncbi:hypothetical protein BC937DRAFT_93916 [Endogone sp. FLAS-F59071]|nr:hypothetical protein BC937DRAFT_93916 [Endogone sp. FLAS-F59071]|eukprot:RUS14381.1 hypothetical protein BC937DRAFT_93916 [Endogone sp. FLAS-F59071]